MIRSILSGSLLGLALLAQPAAAQSRVSSVSIPPGQRPPAGLCRVWIDGVPPGRQPRVTDCRTAHYQAARNGGRVIYGDDYTGNGKAKGKYKNKDKRDDRYDHDDDRYGRREDRRDDRYDRRDDRRDDRYDRRNRDNTCVDANRDGRCDYTQPTIPGTTAPRGSTTQQPTTQRRQTVTERLDSLRREAEAERARRGQR